MRVRSANMFWPKADANHTRGEAAQNWKLAQEAQ
jgi:hypothetical protein